LLEGWEETKLPQWTQERQQPRLPNGWAIEGGKKERRKVFEAFRVAHNIIMPSVEDLRLLDD
jgi:hypothetical protein